MRKPIAAFAALLLCLALLAACGASTGMPNPEAPTFDENAPPTTDAEEITDSTTATQETTTLTTTEAPTTTTKKPNTTSTTATDHHYHPVLLSYKMDENGIFYDELPIWPGQDIWLTQTQQIVRKPTTDTVYSTVHVKFQYDQKDWLIQLRKGRYDGIMLASEICVTEKPITQEAERYYLTNPEVKIV